jgi:hypothetical protein
MTLTSLGIYLFHYSAAGYKDHILGTSQSSFLISLNNFGGVLMAALYYLIDIEYFFIAIGVISAFSGLAFGILINFTHEHPSMLFYLENINDTLPTHPHSLRHVTSKTLIQPLKKLDDHPFATDSSSYAVNAYGVYEKIKN